MCIRDSPCCRFRHPAPAADVAFRRRKSGHRRLPDMGRTGLSENRPEPCFSEYQRPRPDGFHAGKIKPPRAGYFRGAEPDRDFCKRRRIRYQPYCLRSRPYAHRTRRPYLHGRVIPAIVFVHVSPQPAAAVWSCRRSVSWQTPSVWTRLPSPWN